MTSPFPGMDPFLEGQEWEDFHTRFNSALADTLMPTIKPRYAARVERRVYVEHFTEDCDVRYLKADAAVVLTDAGGGLAVASPPDTSTAVEGLLEIEEEHRETFLVIRHIETQEVVTVIETLSPTNKRRGSDGRREYLDKRREVLRSHTSLVELDLLRSGDRLPMGTPLPPGDYYSIVSRGWRRPRASIYAWRLRQPLPSIAIPLLQADGDVEVNLQQVFSTVWDRADYSLTLDYRQPLVPPLSEPDDEWLKSLPLPKRTVAHSQ